MKRIKEKSRLPISFSFRDANNEPQTPNVIRYRIDCDTTGREILGWTDVSPPSQTVNIIVTPSQNAILNNSNTIETKVLTVVADPDTDQQFTDEFEWEVKNVRGLT